MTTEVIYLSNDNLIIVDQVIDQATGAYVNDATVTCTVKDTDGTNVTGQTWPLTLAYVAASNGKYQGVIEDALSVTARSHYVAHVAIDAGGDLVAAFEVPLVAKVRK